MLAHFTAHELPGTLGLVLAAFALGMLSAHRQLRPRRLTIPLLVALACSLVVAVLSDQPDVSLAPWLKTGADITMLVSAGALLAVIARRATRRPALSADER